MTGGFIIQASYFVAAVLFIVGLKRMSSPVTARGASSGPVRAWCWPPS